MKRLFFILFHASILAVSCTKKSENQAEPAPQAKIEKPSFADMAEGKVVMSTTGEWFVVKDGLRWRAMSEPATTDYLNSIANGQDNVLRNIHPDSLAQFPVAGEILPKVEFKKD